VGRQLDEVMNSAISSSSQEPWLSIAASDTAIVVKQASSVMLSYLVIRHRRRARLTMGQPLIADRHTLTALPQAVDMAHSERDAEQYLGSHSLVAS